MKLHSLNCSSCGMPLAFSLAPFPEMCESYCNYCMLSRCIIAEELGIKKHPWRADLNNARRNASRCFSYACYWLTKVNENLRYFLNNAKTIRGLTKDQGYVIITDEVEENKG